MTSYRQKTKMSSTHIITFSTTNNPNIKKNSKYKRVVYVMDYLVNDLNKRLTDILGIKCIAKPKERGVLSRFMENEEIKNQNLSKLIHYIIMIVM